jgi:hypothetical protein
MTLVGGVYPKHFAEIVTGMKRREFRYRQRPDVLLEGVKAGDMLVLFCKRRPIAVRVRITQVRRRTFTTEEHGTDRRGYRFSFTDVEQCSWPMLHRRQGIVRLHPDFG